jgi:hypothetical protein
MGQLVLLPPGDGAPRPLRLRQGGLHEHPCQGGAVHTLTPPDPQLKGARYPGGFNPCAYHVQIRYKIVPFKCNLRRCSEALKGRLTVQGGGMVPLSGRVGHISQRLFAV